MKSRLALACVLVVAGCGGGHHVERVLEPTPKLPRTVALPLASLSDSVAARLDRGDSCGALAAANALQTRTLAAVSAHRVPQRLQSRLLAATRSLVGRISCVPPPSPDEGHGKGEGHGKDNGHGHGKHKGDDD